MEDTAGEPDSGAAASALLDARALRWRHTDRWVVDGVSLHVGHGEIVGLLGPNGAGKTVTLSMLSGLIRPTSGHVFLNGADVTRLPLHRRAQVGLGYLPQERSVFRHLTAVDNVTLVLEAHDRPKREARDRAYQLLEEFGLDAVSSRLAQELSGGEQRRLEVARSLATEPRVLLFDEPFAGIDPLTIEMLHGMLMTLRRRGVGILVTDHNVRETLSLCDRAYVLHEGKVLAEGTPAALVDDSAVRRAFLGEDFEAA